MSEPEEVLCGKTVIDLIDGVMKYVPPEADEYLAIEVRRFEYDGTYSAHVQRFGHRGHPIYCGTLCEPLKTKDELFDQVRAAQAEIKTGRWGDAFDPKRRGIPVSS